MAKIRGVKPEYWTDEDIVGLSIPARLLFIGLWSYACDNGHLQDKPKQIKMRVLPGDDVNVAELLRELATANRIVRADGWITIPNFTKHQRPDRRYFTTCDHPGCLTPQETVSQRESRRVHGVHTTSAPRATDVHTTSARRVPDVCTPCAHVDGDGDGDGDGEVTTCPTNTPDTFLGFWMTYPRKDGKRKAEQEYRSALKRASPEAILAGAQRYRDDPSRSAQYTAMPQTWLHRDSWDDGLLPVGAPRQPAASSGVIRGLGREGW